MTRTHQGGCHCGAVRYQAELDLAAKVSRCNCSMCTKTASAGVNIKPDAFKLLRGEPDLGDYSRGPHSHFRFCKTCGIQLFGHGNIPEVGGEYVSVNVNTLDDVDPAELSFVHWDGRHNNWQAGPRDTPWPVKT
jgi:hypothetical protein